MEEAWSLNDHVEDWQPKTQEQILCEQEKKISSLKPLRFGDFLLKQSDNTD